MSVGSAAAVEYLSAWILEPCLTAPGPALAWLLRTASQRTLRDLQLALVGEKQNIALREALAWEALDTADAVKRAGEFLQDLALIAAGSAPTNPAWTTSVRSGITVYTATHVRKVTP